MSIPDFHVGFPAKTNSLGQDETYSVVQSADVEHICSTLFAFPKHTITSSVTLNISDLTPTKTQYLAQNQIRAETSMP